MKEDIKIAEEVFKRENKKIDLFSIIGAEIKAKRQKSNLTLKETVSGICSTSYLSKFENNSIEANPTFVNKICERISLKYESLAKLYRLDEYLTSIVEYFYTDNYNDMYGIFDDVSEFDNYRAEILRFIYYVYIGDKTSANSSKEMIMKMYRSLTDKEIRIFGLFVAILNYKFYDYAESVTIIKSLYNSGYNRHFKALCNEYLFRCYFKTNSVKAIKFYDICIDDAKEMFLYNKLEEISFLYYKFQVMNYTDDINFSLEALSKTKYYTTAKLIYDLYSLTPVEEGIPLNMFISPFYEMLYLAYSDIERFNIRMQASKDKYSEEEALYLEYLEAKLCNIPSKIEDISVKMCNTAIKLNCLPLINGTNDLARRYYLAVNKYKPIVELEAKARDAIMKIKKI